MMLKVHCLLLLLNKLKLKAKLEEELVFSTAMVIDLFVVFIEGLQG